MSRNFIGQAGGVNISCKGRLKHLWAWVLHVNPQNMGSKAPTAIQLASGWGKNCQDSLCKKFVSREADFLRYVIVKDNICIDSFSFYLWLTKCELEKSII
jgi:hypothetical protein